MKTRNLDIIKKKFNEIETKSDFIDLLNLSKKTIYDGCIYKITEKQLNYHSLANINPNRYNTFTIKKKNGGIRVINSPNKGLLIILKSLNIILESIYTPNENVYGFIPKRNIVDNAKVHINSNYVYNIDLKDFFTSINRSRIRKRLEFPPFNLNSKLNRDLIGTYIAYLCTHEMDVERFINGRWVVKKDFVLPQGSPSSPILTNIICERLDYKLNKLAKIYGLKYSRYADDITFSSMHYVYKKDGAFLKKLNKIINEEGFNINESKTRLQKNCGKQIVTGLTVNKIPNVNKKYLVQLRHWIRSCEKFGVHESQNHLIKYYYMDKGHVKNYNSNIVNIISGKLDFLKMVKGEKNTTFLKLNNRWQKVIDNLENKISINSKKTSSFNSNNFSTILELIITKGINNETLDII